jgi:hypothetical protein
MIFAQVSLLKQLPTCVPVKIQSEMSHVLYQQDGLIGQNLMILKFKLTGIKLKIFTDQVTITDLLITLGILMTLT